MFYDFLMRKSKAGMLPPVLPLLIYNGRRNWNVPLRLEEMIEAYLPKQFIPRFEYFPIIEKNYLDEITGRVAECLKREHREDIRMFSEREPKDWIEIPQKGGNRHMFVGIARRIKRELLNEGAELGKLEQG